MIHKAELEGLEPKEWMLIQKHLKLGPKHLQRHLKAEELQQLYSLTHLQPKAKSRVRPDAAELAAYTTPAFNGILTTGVGFWMGLSGFIGLELNRPLLFFSILGASILAGAVIGYSTYKFSKDRAQRALEKRRTQDLEIYLLSRTLESRRFEIKEKAREFNHILHELGIFAKNEITEELTDNIERDELCLNWLNRLEHQINQGHSPLSKDELLYHAISQEIEESRSRIQERRQLRQKREKMKVYPLIQKLLVAPIDTTEVKKPFWRARLKDLSIAFIPTFFGGFSSLFTYLNGGPKLAEEMGQTGLYSFLTHPRTKTVEFGLAVLITLYFAGSSLYTYYKSYKRDQEIAKAEAFTEQQERVLAMADDKLLKLKDLLAVMNKIWAIVKTKAKQRKAS